MKTEIKFADFGEGLHEGEIAEILVSVGDKVKVDSPLISIQTDKMTDDVTAPSEGMVSEILVEEGQEVHVGDVLLLMETEGVAPEKSETQPSTEEDPSLFKPSKPLKTKSFRKVESSTPAKIVNDRVLASPAVRRRARERGIDLRYVKGSAKNGRITRDDLDSYKESPIPTAQSTYSAPTRTFTNGGIEILPLKGIRKAVAKNMRKSKDLAAHYTYFEEVDMTAMDELRTVLKAKGEEVGVKVTYVAMMMKLLVPVLRKYPLVNSRLVDDRGEIHIYHDLNIGISVDTDDGLIVPVVKHVDQKDIFEIANEIIELANKARSGTLRPDDLIGGTFTITSIGNIGGLMATPIIKHPEVAILGLMKAKLRPVVLEIDGKNEIGIRKMMNLSFSLDHRVIDGAVGARFIRDLIRYMENPGLLYFENL